MAKAKQVEVAVQPLSDEELRKIYAYWRAANYLSIWQICLKDNPLLAWSELYLGALEPELALEPFWDGRINPARHRRR